MKVVREKEWLVRIHLEGADSGDSLLFQGTLRRGRRLSGLRLD